MREINPIVEKANSLDTDYRGKIKNIQCLSCQYSCKDVEFTLNGGCKNYKHRMSLSEINEEIKIQSINIRRLCKEYGLKYNIMQDMLKNKLALSFKYYHIIEMRIMEKNEYDIYVERFENGE